MIYKVYKPKYKLAFCIEAKDEWNKLDDDVRQQLGKKLKKRLENLHAPSEALRNLSGFYKIKLRHAGCRLIYQMHGETLTVVLVGIVGRQDRDAARKKAENRPDS
ncbi:type II toxin-antitoxin system RelE family toxin [Neisseria sp. WLZKY-1]|jgi:hypothetical protein|uniref:type II toxin-antitoxin system RelE family toxin n=1 Tax=Neisseria sp. WLZKY-1 TaxID=3390377 RepID=UPI00397A8E75